MKKPPRTSDGDPTVKVNTGPTGKPERPSLSPLFIKRQSSKSPSLTDLLSQKEGEQYLIHILNSPTVLEAMAMQQEFAKKMTTDRNAIILLKENPEIGELISGYIKGSIEAAIADYWLQNSDIQKQISFSEFLFFMDGICSDLQQKLSPSNASPHQAKALEAERNGNIESALQNWGEALENSNSPAVKNLCELNIKRLSGVIKGLMAQDQANAGSNIMDRPSFAETGQNQRWYMIIELRRNVQEKMQEKPLNGPFVLELVKELKAMEEGYLRDFGSFEPPKGFENYEDTDLGIGKEHEKIQRLLEIAERRADDAEEITKRTRYDLNVVTENWEDILDKLAVSEKQRADEEKENEKLKQQNNDLESENAELRETSESAGKHVELANRQTDILSKKLGAAEKRLLDEWTIHNEKMNKLKRDLEEAAEKRIGELEVQLDTANGNSKLKEEALESLTKEKQDLEERLTELEKQFSELDNNAGATNLLNEELERNNSDLQKSLDELHGKNEDQAKTIKELEEVIRGLRSDVSNANSRAGEAESQRDLLTRNLKESKRTMGERIEKTEGAKKQVEESLSSENGELKSQLDAMTRERKDLLSRIAELEKQLEKAKKKAGVGATREHDKYKFSASPKASKKEKRGNKPEGDQPIKPPAYDTRTVKNGESLVISVLTGGQTLTVENGGKVKISIALKGSKIILLGDEAEYKIGNNLGAEIERC